MKRYYAQGDISFVPVLRKDVPAGLVPVAPVNGRHIFAYGEVTGHHHSALARPGVALLDAPGQSPHRYFTIEELVGSVEVEHQEHGAVALPYADPATPGHQGDYMVVRQREATDNDEGWATVSD